MANSRSRQWGSCEEGTPRYRREESRVPDEIEINSLSGPANGEPRSAKTKWPELKKKGKWKIKKWRMEGAAVSNYEKFYMGGRGKNRGWAVPFVREMPLGYPYRGIK
ncbi:hypothetical protein KM043_013481 [Ampulex compressa]|nr:hypothetical protein KM043_013481 [Ampulex compressa]